MAANVIVSDAQLRDFSTALLQASGLSADDAALTADSLVAANLRAVDSHGVQLIPPYVAQIRGSCPGRPHESLNNSWVDLKPEVTIQNSG